MAEVVVVLVILDEVVLVLVVLNLGYSPGSYQCWSALRGVVGLLQRMAMAG